MATRDWTNRVWFTTRSSRQQIKTSRPIDYHLPITREDPWVRSPRGDRLCSCPRVATRAPTTKTRCRNPSDRIAMEVLVSKDSNPLHEVSHLAYLTTTVRVGMHKNRWCAEVNRLKGIQASPEATLSSKDSREWREATPFSTRTSRRRRNVSVHHIYILSSYVLFFDPICLGMMTSGQSASGQIAIGNSNS